MIKVLYFSFLFAFLSTSVFAQLEESKVLKIENDNTYSYEKIFDAPGKSKEEIFSAIKKWVVTNIKTESNSNFFDEKNYMISTNPAFTCSLGSWVDFKFNIEIKDGKYCLTATSFTWHNRNGIPKKFGDYSGIAMSKKSRKQMINDVDDALIAMTAAIQNASVTKSDW